MNYNLSFVLGLEEDLSRARDKFAGLSQQLEKVSEEEDRLSKTSEDAELVLRRRQLADQQAMIYDNMRKLSSNLAAGDSMLAISRMNEVSQMYAMAAASNRDTVITGLGTGTGLVDAAKGMDREERAAASFDTLTNIGILVGQIYTVLKEGVVSNGGQRPRLPATPEEKAEEKEKFSFTEFAKDMATKLVIPAGLAMMADREVYELRRLRPESGMSDSEIARVAGGTIPRLVQELSGRVDDSYFRQLASQAGVRGFAAEELEKVLKVGGIMKEALGTSVPMSIDTLVSLEKSLLISIDKTPELIAQAQALAEKSTRSAEDVLKNIISAAEYVQKIGASDRDPASRQFGAISTALQDTGASGDAAARAFAQTMSSLADGYSNMANGGKINSLSNLSGISGVTLERAAQSGDTLTVMKAIEAAVTNLTSRAGNTAENLGFVRGTREFELESLRLERQLVNGDWWKNTGIDESLFQTVKEANRLGGYGRADDTGGRMTLEEWVALGSKPDQEVKMESTGSATKLLDMSREMYETTLTGIGHTLQGYIVPPMELLATLTQKVTLGWQKLPESVRDVGNMIAVIAMAMKGPALIGNLLPTAVRKGLGMGAGSGGGIGSILGSLGKLVPRAGAAESAVARMATGLATSGTTAGSSLGWISKLGRLVKINPLVTGLVMGLTEVAGILTKFGKAGGFSDTWDTITKGLAIFTEGGTTAKVAAFGDALESLQLKLLGSFDKFKGSIFWAGTWPAMKLFEEASTGLSERVSRSFNIATGIILASIEGLKSNFNSIADFMEKVKKLISVSFGQLKEEFNVSRKAITKLAEDFSKKFPWIGKAVDTVVKSVKSLSEWLGTLYDKFNLFSGLGKTFDKFLNMFSGAEAVGSRYWNASDDAFGSTSGVPLVTPTGGSVGGRASTTPVAPMPTMASSGVPFSAEILAASMKYGVDPALIAGIIDTESDFNPVAGSNKGARGLMQIMPATGPEIGLENREDFFDPAKNIDAGTLYISRLLKRYDGNVQLALAAYNGGMGNVDNYGGIPPFAETQAYVPSVLRDREKYKDEFASMVAGPQTPTAGSGNVIVDQDKVVTAINRLADAILGKERTTTVAPVGYGVSQDVRDLGDFNT